MELILAPYKSVGRLTFGSEPEALMLVLGKPLIDRVDNRGESALNYANLNLIFSLRGLQEITIFPEAGLHIEGKNIFEEPDVYGYLNLIDSGPLECVGIIFYPKLGLSVGGTELGVDFSFTAIAKGRFDSLLPKFKPAKFE